MNPQLFGKSAKAKWKPQTDTKLDRNSPDYAAAYLQHTFACQVEEACREDGLSSGDLADTAGLSTSNLSHILRGRQTVTFASMIAIVRALGRVEIMPAPGSLNDLFP